MRILNQIFLLIYLFSRYDTEDKEAESDEEWEDDEEDGLEAVYKDNLEVSLSIFTHIHPKRCIWKYGPKCFQF